LKRRTIDEDEDQIPCEGEHRGVPLHRGQCARRLAVVRADIDHVRGLSTVEDLMDCLRNGRLAPESRLFGAAKLLAMHDSAAKARDATPINRDLVVALSAPLSSFRWRSPVNYGADLLMGERVPLDPDDEPIEA
jgi:hypothetical protein